MTALTCLAGIAIVAGCGGGDGGGSEEITGPATIVPASAPAYFEVSVRPEGSARDGAEAAAGKILDTDDPGPKVISLIEDAAAANGQSFNWDEDVAPWLGDKVGVYPTSLARESEVGLVIETTDPEKALDFVRTEDTVTGPEREYNGTSFQIDSDGDAFGIVDDFLVSAPRKGFKKIVDGADEASLADSSTYKGAVDGLPDDRLATLYAIPRDFLEAIPRDEIDPDGRKILLKALGDSADQPVLGDITASADDIQLELSAGGGGVETEQSPLLAQLPAEAWLAFGLGDIGAAVQNGLDSLASAKGGDSIRSLLEEQSGLDLEQVAQSLGGGAIFVQGTTINDLRGALIVQSNDEEASANLLDALESLISNQAGGEVRVQSLSSSGSSTSSSGTDSGSGTIAQTGFQIEAPDLPQPIQVVQQGGRIVAGYGGGIVGEIINSSGKTSGLTGTPGFRSAESALGPLGVDAFLSFEPVFDLAENLGAEDDPGFERAKPYLNTLNFLALGSGGEEDRALLRFILGLR